MLGTNMAFVCYLLLKELEANIHINLICFDRNFDHPHVNVVTFVSSQKSHNFFPQKHSFFAKKVFDIYLLLSLFSLFSQNNHPSLKNRYSVVVSLRN